MKTKENRKISTEEKNKKIVECKEELFNLRFKQAMGTIETPARIHELRKTIARLKTILKEREIQG